MFWVFRAAGSFDLDLLAVCGLAVMFGVELWVVIVG